jgi:hypothetical protein
MSISQPHFGVPELKSLPPCARATVWRECIHPLTLRFGFQAFWFFAVAASGAFGGLVGHWSIAAPWGAIVLAGLFAGIGSYITSWMAAWRYREQIRRFIDQHRSDLPQ